ncbi:MAG: DNA phosphorothioation-associated putative methyltransferase [Planctomycetaceae bacterium]|nr:DNA phosphorothioation-associated putative methyltransferase [Planctomycetaceae bacterium]
MKRTVQRHKTAIRRPGFSLPVKSLLRDGLLDASTSFFDYGCGHGQDLRLLADMGIQSTGWDPVFRPDERPVPADVVNLGYVINVIEDPRERSAALAAAWGLCRQLLVVAAQVEFAAPDKEQAEYGDGVLTTRGTFQKYYRQHELRGYLESELTGDAIPAAPGVFYVFRDESAKQQFLATRYHRRIAVPRRRISELVFEENRDVLEPLMETLTALGRLPGPEEFSLSGEVVQRFGSLKRAFALVRRVTEEEPWEEIAQRRTEDLLVYLALSRFRRRPKLSQLPGSIQRDVKSFLGSYQAACARADVLLFRTGDPDAIDGACQRAGVGQLVDNALIVHRSALDGLEPILRIYEGCARALVGEIDEANVIKLHRLSGKVSYLSYPDFERNPHPALRQRVKVTLPTLSIDFFDYREWEDPPILCRKEELVGRGHEFYEKFARLTREEERWGHSYQILDRERETAFCSASDSPSMIRVLLNPGRNCAVVALSAITGISESAISRLLSEVGGRRDGATPPQILLVLERLGYEWSVEGTQKARQMTAREVSAERWPGAWLVFTFDHVMPLIRGRVTNFNGCGDERITFVMEVRRKDNVPCPE